MDQDLKAKWVAALRSGDYKQGRKRLHQTTIGGEKYCCLGVLCEVFGFAKTERGGYTVHDGDFTYEMKSLLETKALDRVGLDSTQQRYLASMNDAAGNTFKHIADYIERNVW